MCEENNHRQSTRVILTSLVTDLELAFVVLYSYIHVFPLMKIFLKKMASHRNGAGFNYININNNNNTEKIRHIIEIQFNKILHLSHPKITIFSGSRSSARCKTNRLYYPSCLCMGLFYVFLPTAHACPLGTRVLFLLICCS